MFSLFSKAVHERFMTLSKGELFVVDLPNLFDKYLAAYPEGTNLIFRKRAIYDCQCCKQFVRRLGKVVAIENGVVKTVWDEIDLPEPFLTVAGAMRGYVLRAPIKSVFRTKERNYGVDHNYDKVTNERYEHFHGQVSNKHYSLDPETRRGEQDAIFQVMKRGLSEIREVDLNMVLDLIESNGLYRGEEHKDALIGFRQLLQSYREVGQKDAFVWENLGNRNARFRNTVIGTLLVDLSEGKDTEDAVKAFESKVAPMNYKRPTAVITQKMVEQAVQTLTDLGLGGAIYRRFAKLSDVSVNDILFVDNESRSAMKDGISLLLSSSVKSQGVDVRKTIAIRAESFVESILPTAKSLEVFVENRHTGNFLSLTGSDGPERPFKWGNNFAWSYDGDVTDSVKQRVKAAGGNIHAKLRVSLSWFNTDDLDLHAQTPSNAHIYFGNKNNILDVDMNAGAGLTRNAVENLAFNSLQDGVYKIWVNQYRQRETVDIGFAIEVEFDGVINQYSYGKAVKDNVTCFMLRIENGRLVKIDTDLVGGATSQDKWGVKTESLVPVVAVMNSPNHWGENRIGAKHLIFALRDCRNPNPTRGIYNEYLRSDLDKHRKVFEVLGSKSKCPATNEQVSGVGFTSARGDTATVVVDGRRSYTITF